MLHFVVHLLLDLIVAQLCICGECICFEKGCSKGKGAIWIKMMQNFVYNPFTETNTK